MHLALSASGPAATRSRRGRPVLEVAALLVQLRLSHRGEQLHGVIQHHQLGVFRREAGIEARLQNNVDARNHQSTSGYVLSYSLGVVPIDLNSSTTMEDLLSQADAAMYKHKQARKRTV